MSRRRQLRTARSNVWNVVGPLPVSVSWVPPMVQTHRGNLRRRSTSAFAFTRTPLVLHTVPTFLSSKRRFARHASGGGIFAPPVRLVAKSGTLPTFTTNSVRRVRRTTRQLPSFIPKVIPQAPPKPWIPPLVIGRHARSLRVRRGSYFVPTLGPIVPPPPPLPWLPPLLSSRRPLHARSRSLFVNPVFPLPVRPILPNYSPTLLRSGVSARSTHHQHLSSFVAPLTFIVPPIPPPTPLPTTPEEEYGSMSWARRQWRKRHRPTKGLDRSSVWRNR